MQNSRANIQEAGPDRVVIDFHNAAWDLLDKEQPYGFAFQKTTEHLGLEPHIENGDYGRRLYLTGATESVQEHIPGLQRHIGLIARAGSRLTTRFSGSERDYIGRTLGRLIQHDLPALPPNATLLRTAGVIAWPFVDAVGDDLTEVYYARKPYWHGNQNTPAVHEDGTPMARFEVRDIGGLLIGRNGLPAAEAVPATVRLKQTSIDALYAGREEDESLGGRIRAGLRFYLDMPDKPQVAHNPLTIPKMKPGEYYQPVRNVFVSFARTDLERLARIVPEDSDVTLGDYVRAGIDAMLQRPAESNE